MTKSQELVRETEIKRSIYLVRGHPVLLDEDLASMYGVETKVLNQAVTRNLDRFPEDFMFALSKEEWDSLRSQIVTSKPGRGGRRYPPRAFTEQGVAMLSGVLNSPRAIRVNIEIMRTFVRLREILGSHELLAKRLDALERKYDRRFRVVFEAIRQLMETPRKTKEQIGFRPHSKNSDE